MDTVYLVTDGDYSDYRIQAAFSSREKAEAYIAVLGSGDVEEWSIDSDDDPVTKKCYRAWIDLKSGDVRELDYVDDVVVGRNKLHGPLMEDDDTIVIDSYVSMEHAVKLLAEARQAHLRNAAAV